MISVWFLGGLIILFLGVIGTYIAKIFIETKGRPLTIVRAVHRNDGGGKPAAGSS
jgi:putative glycosyltransferase